ncbi:MAG: ATP-binding protein, partial [gamma proteobacterium symbiont of Bathyaustriella thionipta]|nr:ATP-binding protein [gamma proteobacterium symbiont of Bathyaustriella thionipta]
MIDENNTRIAFITRINGDEFEARAISEKDGFMVEVQLGNDHVIVGQIGSYLAVAAADIKLLVMVNSMWQEEAEDGELIRHFTLIPLGEVKPDGGFERGVKHYPTTGAEVHLLKAEQLSGMLGQYNEAGYKVGYLSSFESMPVFLDPDALFGRHLAILGQSGSGKSWTVTSLIQSALNAMPNAHIVLLDLHGEYSFNEFDAQSHSPFPPDKVRSLNANDLEIPYWLLTYVELLELLTDPGDPNYSVQIAFLRDTVFELKKKANEHMGLGHITVDTPLYFPLVELYMRCKKVSGHSPLIFDPIQIGPQRISGKFLLPVSRN